MELTLKQIAQWVHADLPQQDAAITIHGICTDSRLAKEGNLFIPLKGQTFDGHDFLEKALMHASAALSSRKIDTQKPVLYVQDTEKAYGDLAKGYRAQLSARVVGITGSVGKTTTKEMTACVLASQFRTAKTEGNHNNQIGLPQTILSIEADCEAAVLEMGMNHFGEMAYLTAIAQPDLAVITNIGTSHIEHLGSREGILKAKLEILQGLRPGGVLLLNGDEPLLWQLRGKTGFETVYFGIENTACEIVAKEIVPHAEGVSFHVEGLKQEFEVYVPAPGMHNIYNALAAISAGLLFKVEPQNIQQALENFQNTGMRQKIYETQGFTIIEDCYNAGPESMEAALNVLAQQQCTGRKIAVLGDMLELGSCSMAEHYKVGRQVAQTADMLFAYGSNAERMVTGAITGGMPNNCVLHFNSHEQMARMLRNRARAGDILLFKGSRGMRMEHVLSLFLQPDRD